MIDRICDYLCFQGISTGIFKETGYMLPEHAEALALVEKARMM